MHIIDLAPRHAAPITEYDSRAASAQLLADGHGEAHVYAVHFAPGGQTGPHPAGFGQLFCAMTGVGWVAGADGVRHELRSGQAAVIARGEVHAKGSDTGLSALMVQIADLSVPSPEAGSAGVIVDRRAREWRAGMTSMGMHVRPARAEDGGRLLEVWERSVRATHHFLSDVDIAALHPLVAEELASDAVDWWVLATEADVAVGFLGLTTGTIEALFVDPDHHGQGGGKMLVAHAQTLVGDAPLAVDVNEQNDAALGFYKALGFFVTSRSSTDAGGRPFPILHMRRVGSRRAGVV